MAIYKFMLCMVVMFMVLSYGNGQKVKQAILCDLNSFNFDADCYYRSYYGIRCEPYHVITITNITLGYFNETEERTCCQKMPDNICTVEVNEENYLGYYYRDMSSCVLSHTCFMDMLPYHTINRNDSCTSSDFLANIEYMCVSNTSIINMTKPGINDNFNSLSLSYDGWRYLRFDTHFYCSCEITADDDDVYIYTTVFYLRLDGNRYNTSVTIDSRDHTVLYDANNTDMTQVDIHDYKYLVYKQLKQIKGPIHLIYEGDQLKPYIDIIWIDFKASQGRIKSNCRGCQAGYSIPPIFDPQTTDSKGTMDSTGQPTSSSSDIYKTALICVLSIIAVLGLVMMGVVVCKKRQCIKDKIEAAKDVPQTSGSVSGVQTVSGTVSDIPTVSNLPPGSGDGSEMYDTMEMNNQPVDVYDSLEPDTIYEDPS